MGGILSPSQQSQESSPAAHSCEAYELRVTRRCLEEDLDYYEDAPFEDLAGHEIIKALINRRSDGPTDTREVSPLSSGKRVYRLAYGNRHRGATWFDENEGVVWLLGYAQHEFEDRGDAFSQFKDLDEEGHLLPGPADYEALLRERDARFGASLAVQAEALLAEARRNPGREVVAHLGGAIEVTVAITVVETLGELHVAIQMTGLPTEHFLLVLAALFDGRDMDEIESAEAMPGRDLQPGELGFRILLN
jgi:hypothetical protein